MYVSPPLSISLSLLSYLSLLCIYICMYVCIISLSLSHARALSLSRSLSLLVPEVKQTRRPCQMRSAVL